MLGRTVLIMSVLALAGCERTAPAPSPNALPPTPSGFPGGPVTIMAPANPGGGWDQTARQIQQVLSGEGILPVPVEVVNRGGAGGTIGLADLVTRSRGNPRILMVFGRVMLGAILTNDASVSLDDTVPVARLLNEYEVVAVGVDSPFETLSDLLAAFRAAPRTISWGGGSAGGTDHMLVGMIARSLGVDPAGVNYVAYSGGGEAAASVMGGHVSAGVSGYAEWRAHADAGRMRLLAVSSEARIPGDDTPTLVESGVDLTLANWRGVTAPPGTGPDERGWLIEALSRMRESEAWERILAANRWEDSFLAGDAFEEFLRVESMRDREVLQAIGLIAGEP